VRPTPEAFVARVDTKLGEAPLRSVRHRFPLLSGEKKVRKSLAFAEDFDTHCGYSSQVFMRTVGTE
jgi:hypothetical protein